MNFYSSECGNVYRHHRENTRNITSQTGSTTQRLLIKQPRQLCRRSDSADGWASEKLRFHFRQWQESYLFYETSWAVLGPLPIQYVSQARSSVSRVPSGRCVKLSTRFQLLPRLRMSGAISPLHRVFMACIETTLPFTRYSALSSAERFWLSSALCNSPFGHQNPSVTCTLLQKHRNDLMKSLHLDSNTSDILTPVQNVPVSHCGGNAFSPRPVHVGFMVEKLTLGQVNLPVLQFHPVSVIPLELHAYSFTNPWCYSGLYSPTNHVVI